jgi:hypothetical protein
MLSADKKLIEKTIDMSAIDPKRTLPAAIISNYETPKSNLFVLVAPNGIALLRNKREPAWAEPIFAFRNSNLNSSCSRLTLARCRGVFIAHTYGPSR